MVKRVIWAARRFLTGKRFSQTDEKTFSDFKARVARIETVLARASQEWEGYFATGAVSGADPIARSYHAYVQEMMEDLAPKRRHPKHDKAIKAAASLQQEVGRLRVAAGLPRKQPADLSTEPPDSSELAAARLAAAEAVAEIGRTKDLPLPAVTTEDLKTATYENKCLYGWAAHVLPEAEFEDFFLDLWERFNPGSSQVRDAKHAFQSVQSLRHFQRLEKALERYPDLPFSYDEASPEDLLRAEWKTSDPLVRDSDPTEKIAAIFAGFSADDLHEVAHGRDLSSAPFILAVAEHPLCDWASALEILHSYSAASYQSYWVEGKAEDDFSDEDRLIFKAFETIAHRANGIGFRSRLFDTGFEFQPVSTSGKPNPHHPENWVKWTIPEQKLLRPEGRKHTPRIVFDHTSIRPTFDVWKETRG